MTRSALAVLVLALLAACAPSGRYPVSGEACAPGDPVAGLEVPDCLPR
jgi:hypothetical protein